MAIKKVKRAKKRMRKHPKISVLNLILIGLLIVLTGFIVYQNVLSKPPSSQKAQDGFESKFNEFLAVLHAKNISKQQAHTELHAYLSSLQQKKMPKAAEVQKYAASATIPNDYKYFFETCLPAYVDSQKASLQKPSDAHIIFSLPPNSTYKARIAFNTENLPLNSLSKLLNSTTITKRVKNIIRTILRSSKTQERIVVSGTYTSPYSIPVGLAVNKGEIVNPALQKWDGLLLIKESGKLFISHLDELQYGFRDFHLRTSYKDYIDFLEMAKQTKLSVIQSHLLLNNGEILIKKDPNQKKFRRRVIFQTQNQGLYIYDSFDKQALTLFETAKLLKEHYKAVKAINLDIGVYNYCVLYSGNTMLKNYSNLQKGVVLSNLIVIDK